MREIKFRGKCLESDTWIYGSLFNSIWRKSADGSRVCYIFPDNMLDDDNGGGDCWEDFAEVAEQYEVAPATVGQYTGLKDKNGEKIYEGDIVEWENIMKTNMRSVIAYRDRMFCFVDANNEPEEIWCCSFTKIGNIHDNPELLK